MKKITLLIAILITTISWQTNAQVAIGNGTEEKSIPINPYFGYSYSQNIYLASEINASGTITSLKFQYNGHSTLDNSKDWVVYLGHTSKTEFDSTTDWIPVADLTEVYNGTITAVGSGSPEWITIDITDFAYNGTDNLVVAVDENTSGYDSFSDDFYASAVTGDRSIVINVDNSNPDPATPPEADDVQAFVPNIIFEGITQTCPTPTDLAVANETTTSADISWTENGSATAWNIEYGPAGFTQGQGTTVSASSNPFTLSGLTSGTAYDVYVQGDCGGGDSSSWAGPVSFNTMCDAKVAPYSQNFDAATQPDLPICWTKIINSTGTSDFIHTYDYQAPSTPNVVKFKRSNDNAELYLISPEFSDFTHQKMISFTASTLTHSADLVVGTMSDPNDASTFVAFQTISLTTSYEDYDVYFTSYSGTNHYVAFMPATGSQEPIYLDDFEYKEAPSCIPPSDLAIDNITTTGADVSWTENGSATAWNIEYGPAGFTQGQGSTVAASSNPFTLSGLTSATTYDVYVQADCGGGDSSSWVGPYTFATPPSCGDTFYDDGGATGNYSAYLNQTITIYPTNAGDVVTVTFNSFDMENKWDGMMVYDGPDANAPLIDSGSTYGHTYCPNGAWTGAAGDPYTANGHSFTSTDPSGSLTFVFTSDSSTQKAGWEAVVTCGPQAISDNQIAGFKFYPNPVNHTLNLSAKDNIEMISISNVMGQEVLHLLPNATEAQVNMSSLQNGIYFVKAQVNGELTAFKVIKK